MSTKHITLLLALFATAAMAAPAHATKYRSNVKILVAVMDADVTFFDGKVTSPKPACVEGRKVRLYLKRDGDDKLIGIDRATDEGFWNIRSPDAGAGTYYARVKRKTVGPKGNRHVCRAARSATRTL
jgi:hypothetical protein